MGKLHSLRKQIKQEPEEWYVNAEMSETIFGKIPLGAARKGNRWLPASASYGTSNAVSYIMFVRSVLWDLGIKTDKPRSVKNVHSWRNRGSLWSKYKTW